MKTLLCWTLLVAVASSAAWAAESPVGRTINDLDIIPAKILQRGVSPKFYQSLLISPIRGWVTVRGQLSGTRLSGLRVVRAEPNHANDHLALQRASEAQLAGDFSIERPNTRPSVLVHLLLYETADGTLALSFAHMEGAGGDQSQYYGSARLAVLKKDSGQWVNIKGPPELEGKGWKMKERRNDYDGQVLRLERIEVGGPSS